MFLPALLVRDMGVWAWVIFALPNVVGAAAMGWVLQRQGLSETLTAKHAGAMTAFSVVTVLFHVLFVCWVVQFLGGWMWVAAAAAMAGAFYPILRVRRTALVLSVIVLLVSLGAFVTAVMTADHAPVPATGSSEGLLPLAVACLIGFALCPYLDLTFHRARQATGTYAAIAAFTIGFGVFFLLMILFTLWYAPIALPPDAGGRGAVMPVIVFLVIVAHMAAQSGFTVAAHSVEVFKRLGRRHREGRMGAIVGLVFGAVLLAGALVIRDRNGYQPLAGPKLSGPELGYRLFMSFYALVAPAYVLMRLTPWRGGRSTDRARWVGFFVVLAVAAPGFWMGFVERQMIWVLPGAVAILLGRPILEWTARPQSR
jgi:hypothetical protein